MIKYNLDAQIKLKALNYKTRITNHKQIPTSKLQTNCIFLYLCFVWHLFIVICNLKFCIVIFNF